MSAATGLLRARDIASRLEGLPGLDGHDDLVRAVRDRLTTLGVPTTVPPWGAPDLVAGNTGLLVATDRSDQPVDVRAALAHIHPSVVDLVLVTTRAQLAMFPASSGNRVLATVYLRGGTR